MEIQNAIIVDKKALYDVLEELKALRLMVEELRDEKTGSGEVFPEKMTVRQVAHVLGKQPRTIHRYAQNGQLTKYFDGNGQPYFLGIEVKRFKYAA